MKKYVKPESMVIQLAPGAIKLLGPSINDREGNGTQLGKANNMSDEEFEDLDIGSEWKR